MWKARHCMWCFWSLLLGSVSVQQRVCRWLLSVIITDSTNLHWFVVQRTTIRNGKMKLMKQKSKTAKSSYQTFSGSLLKLWYRELEEPLIPSLYYDRCVDNCSNATTAIEIVYELPDVNRLCLSYLIRFLQVLNETVCSEFLSKP